MSEGWVCPICGGVNAPWVARCPCEGKCLTYTTLTPQYQPPYDTGDPLPPEPVTTCGEEL